ncbi:MAG: hypothetical protein EOP52_04545 [Sphingobacteriales bacterium]|nr:MAG: hypothetical protein EOP52_04545 [Sphingobacteriales bacterium]
MLSKIYPRQLSSGAEAVVVALSDTEAGKMYQSAPAAEAESQKLQFANDINGLMVRILRTDVFENHAVLVLERLYPLDFRSMEVEKRKNLLDVFVDELRELNEGGFVHGHLRREPGFMSDPWDNILLTEDGLRLIDAGRSVLRQDVPEATYDEALAAEALALDAFREWFIAR